MIIWGSKSKEKEVGAGQFHCPNCDEQSSYIHKKVGRYFTLYFIPLFQTEELGEFVECQRCQQAYKPNVLQREDPLPSRTTVSLPCVPTWRTELPFRWPAAN